MKFEFYITNKMQARWKPLLVSEILLIKKRDSRKAAEQNEQSGIPNYQYEFIIRGVGEE